MTDRQGSESATPLKPFWGIPGNERVTAFSDGVFAIGITLMVFEIKVPDISPQRATAELPQALLALLPSFLGFVISFVLVGIYWVGQHNMYLHIKRHDRIFLWLNNLFLLWIALMPFPAALIARYPDEEVSLALYAAVLILAGLTLDGIWAYATHHHRLVDESISQGMIRKVHRKVLTAPCLYLLAMAISWVSLPITWILFAIVAASYIFPDPFDLIHQKEVLKQSQEHQ